MGSLIGDDAREAFVRRVRLEMARQALTREALADRAGVKERTLGNLLAGQSVRDATVAKVAQALKVDLDGILGDGAAGGNGERAGAAARASEAYGGYMLSAWEAYLGTYIAYRRGFSRAPMLYRSVFEIDWDEEQQRLRFFELQRFSGPGKKMVTSSHAGGIYISPHTGLLQLLTTFQGALRLVTLTRFRLGDNKLCGLILTQSDRDLYYQPAASAIFLEKQAARRPSAELERLIGHVKDGEPDFASAMAEIERIEAESVCLAGPGPVAVPAQSRRE